MQREAGEAAQLLAGMTVKSIETLGEQSAAGMLDKNGVLILSVATGGAAEKAGLRPGDVILGIAGRSGVPARMTPDATSLINAFQTRKWQASLPLMVLRNQQGIELVIDVN
jgi:S1-C subfamily serine protease